MKHRDATAGYTLLELLVAFSLMLLVGTLIFDGLSFGSRIWETSEASLRDQDRYLELQRLLPGWIKRAFPYPDGTEGEETAVAFHGTEHSLAFVTMISRPEGNGLAEIALSWEPGTQALTAHFRGIDQPWEETRVLAENLAAVTFYYFGPELLEERKSWSTSYEDRLPELVLVRIRTDDHHWPAWPDIVVAPKLNAYPWCVANSQGVTCGEEAS